MTGDAEPLLPPCPPGGPRPHDVRAAIAAWVGSPALATLLTTFGGAAPSGPLAAVLDEVERFSRQVWDFRAGGERADATLPAFPSEVDAVVRTQARTLGVAGRQQPASSRYDHLLVLGGGVRTSLARAHFTARLLADGLTVGEVSGLGSMRALHDRERQAARQLGLPSIVSEADAMAAALTDALYIRRQGPKRQGVTALAEQWEAQDFRAGERMVHVIGAPSSRPGQRANTADTLAGWAELVAAPTRGQRLLVVTTDLFVPFQHCDAVRVLGVRYGCGVETVGFDTAADRWVSPYPTALVLQEVRSAVRSMQLLLRALPAPGDADAS